MIYSCDRFVSFSVVNNLTAACGNKIKVALKLIASPKKVLDRNVKKKKKSL